MKCKMSETEQWRDAVGFPDIQVSDLGRVRSRRGLKLGRSPEWRILKTTAARRGGYLRVGLTGPGKTLRVIPVHRLVLEAFIGLRPPGTVGCHADDDVTNNRLSNLRWDTSKSNATDAVRNGK